MIRLSLVSLLVAAALLDAGAASAQPKRPPAVAVASADPAQAQPADRRLRLRPEVNLGRDLVTFGDLIPGLSGDLASVAAFRGPALGETGTIQVGRIVEAARGAGIIRDAAELENQGFAQVVVTRSARRIGAAEMEAAVKLGLQQRFGVDARLFALAIDGGAPSVAIEPELTGAVTVSDLTFDARSRRLQARLAVPGSAAMRLKPLHISGQLVETIEVVVPKRAIARGETKVGKQASALGLDYDVLVIGHWHQMIWLPRVIVSGTLKGWDEYARSALRAPPSPPCQPLWFVHPRRGITSRWEIRVDEPGDGAGEEWVSFRRAA